MRPAWVEIRLDLLRENIRNLKKCISNNAEFMGVIKADGYGHGALKVAEVLKQEGATSFAVAIIEEAIELRENGFAEPILMLSYPVREDYEKIIKYNVTSLVYKCTHAENLSKAAQRMNLRAVVHLKVDTGMGRLGFMPGREAVEEIKKILKLPNIYFEGICSHLATADCISNKEYALGQYKRFQDFIGELEKENIIIPIKHMANSAATINYPEMHFNLVRPGTSMYGLYPGPEMLDNPTIELFPVMSIKAKLVHIKRVPKGTAVSYGGTFVTERESVLGVVPMGYVDGVFRQLSNRGEVLVRGRRCRIVGNICMDQFLVDLTDLSEVKVNDEVVFLGNQGDESITADEIGKLIGSISIEVVTRINKRMPLVYIDK